MADADEDCSSNSSGDDEQATSVSRADTGAAPQKKKRRKSAVSSSCSDSKQRVRLPTNLQQISQIKNNISKQLMGQDVDRNMSLRIIEAALEQQETHLQLKQKLGKEVGR